MNMPTTLWCDNKGAIQLAQNLINQKRTKHVDITIFVTKWKRGISFSIYLLILTKNRANPKYLRRKLFGGSQIIPSVKRIRIYTRLHGHKNN
jgi:hypothetical protein